MGYRHIDCAMIYQNEHEVGEVFGEMLDKEVPRSEFFIVGKVRLCDNFEIRVVLVKKLDIMKMLNL